MAEGHEWLISRRADLTVLIGPALLTVALALLIPVGMPLGTAGWLLVVVGIDVAHVYASLYRTYADPDERSRHPVRYACVPVGAFTASILLYAASSALFWTALAYLAVYHFVRQQIGYLALYRLREGLRNDTTEAQRERLALLALMIWPVLWWHAHLPRAFDWFLPGDFLPVVPMWFVWLSGVPAAGVVVAHIVARSRSGRAAPGRDLWLLTTGAVWMVGIVLTNGDLAFTLTNVVLHGVPYLTLVALTCRRKWASLGRGPFERRAFEGAGLLLYLAPLLVLAFAEEAGWDLLVWHDQPELFGASAVGGLNWLFVPLLSVPQITHYVLDGFIWKLGEQNPGLRAWLTEGHEPSR